MTSRRSAKTPHRRSRSSLLIIAAPAAWSIFRLSAALGSNGIELTGVSTQAHARGGADVAVGDTVLSQVENPATLSLLRPGRPAMDLAGHLLFPRVQWSTPVDTDQSDLRLIPLLNLGVGFPVNSKFAYGVAFQSKSGIGTDYEMRHILFPLLKRRVGSDLKDLSLSVNAAYKLTDRLSLGLGVRVECATAEFGTVLGPAGLDFGRGYGFGGGFGAGLHFQVRPDVAIGLAYRSPTWFGDVSGGNAQASLLGILPVGLGSARIDHPTFPQRLAAGIAWDVSRRLKLVGEARWINYSHSVMNSFTVETNSLIDLRLALPLGYRDQVVWIAGAEYKLSDRWTVSAGYNFGANPVPRLNVSPVGSVIAEHHVMAGVRYTRDNWWVGAAYELAFRNDLSGPGSTRIPLGVDNAVGHLAQMQHNLLLGFGFYL